MKKYEQYIKSPIPTLNETPIHWKNVRNKYIFKEKDSRNDNENAVLLSVSHRTGITPKSSFAKFGMPLSESLIGYKNVNKTNFVMNIMQAWKGSMGVSKYEGVVSPAYAVFEFINIPNHRYYNYLLTTPLFCEYFKMFSTGIGESRLRLYPDTFLSLISISPPPHEQDQIVRFLDWKVTEINCLLNIRKREIALLSELKKAIITAVITHGLNLDVAMAEGDNRLLGYYPAHWKITKLRQLLRLFSEKNHPDLPLLSVVREQGVIIRDITDRESNHNYIPDDLSGYKMVKKGQFVMNKMKAWQGSYGISNFTGIVSPAYFVFDVNFDNLEYFHYAIRSKVYVNFFAQASDGIRIGQWDLSIDKMKEIPFLIPPEEEQIAIMKYIPKAIEKYDDGIEKLHEEIAILHELKIKLISDAVTGQIDIRNVNIPDQEYVEENFEIDYRDIDESYSIGSEEV